MSIEEILQEFAILQERRWGADRASRPMVKIVKIEKLF